MTKKSGPSGRMRLTALVVLATGCLGSHEMGAGRDMSAVLADAEAETERHAGACGDAASIPEMLDELDRHEDAMGNLMTTMMGSRDRMLDMHGCSGASFDHMSTSLEEAGSEMSEHRERMRTASTLDDAKSECEAHTERMAGMMQGMMGDLDAMPCMHGGPRR